MIQPIYLNIKSWGGKREEDKSGEGGGGEGEGHAFKKRFLGKGAPNQ